MSENINKNSSLEKEYARIIEIYALGSIEEARSKLLELTNEYSNFGLAYSDLAAISFNQGKILDAIINIKKACELNSQDQNIKDNYHHIKTSLQQACEESYLSKYYLSKLLVPRKSAIVCFSPEREIEFRYMVKSLLLQSNEAIKNYDIYVFDKYKNSLSNTYGLNIVSIDSYSDNCSEKFYSFLESKIENYEYIGMVFPGACLAANSLNESRKLLESSERIGLVAVVDNLRKNQIQLPLNQDYVKTYNEYLSDFVLIDSSHLKCINDSLVDKFYFQSIRLWIKAISAHLDFNKILSVTSLQAEIWKTNDNIEHIQENPIGVQTKIFNSLCEIEQANL